MAEEERISPAAVIIPVGLGLLAVVGVLAALGWVAPPTPPPGLANLYGKVTTVTGKPIPGVLVSLNGAQVYTDAQGNYIFEALDPGEYVLQFSKAGYETLIY